MYSDTSNSKVGILYHTDDIIVELITERVGNVQPKKETQTVRVVKGEDE